MAARVILLYYSIYLLYQCESTNADRHASQMSSAVAARVILLYYSVYLLNYYKSTNTDRSGAHSR